MVLKQPKKDPVYEGDCCYRWGDFQNAMCWFNRGLKKNPENIVLLTKKANTLVKLGRNTKACEFYNKAFFYARVFEIIDGYIEQYQMDLDRDVHNLMALLNSKYFIPITLDGLKFVLKKTQEDLTGFKKIKEWQEFKKNIQRKNLYPIEDNVDLYLKKFGEKFYTHFWRFYCYLREEKGYTKNPEYFADILIKERKKLELNQFDHMLRSGGGKHSMLDKMTGVEFEKYLSMVFENKGCIVQRTPPSHDYGADLIVEHFGEIGVVQSKRKKSSTGLKAVQEISSARKWYKAHKAIVITTGSFTKPAVELASVEGVELWDRKRLLDEISKPGF